MPYAELFDRVSAHVRRQGLTLQIKHGDPISADKIEENCARNSVPVPQSIRDFYIEMGDGFRFAWSVDNDNGPFTNIEFPSLTDLIAENVSQRHYRIEWNDDYQFPFAEDPAAAKKMAMRMRRWIGFHDEGNGDRFCVDTSASGMPVVFDPASCFDGIRDSDIGHPLGTSLLDFYQSWSTVCFQLPSGLWWPGVFKDSGGVDWSSEEFCLPFRL